VGDQITFTITLTNRGPNPATAVQVTDLLPTGLTFVSATASQGTYVSGSGLWTVGTVTPGTPQSLAIVATVVSAAGKTNPASVAHADQFDPIAANNTSSAAETPQQADLAVAKTVSNPTPNVGDTIAFTVIVTNTGPDDATGVLVRDPLPAGLIFVSALPTQGTYNNATGLWSVGTVNAGSPETLVILVKVNSSQAQTNTAIIDDADQFDPDLGDNQRQRHRDTPACRPGRHQDGGRRNAKCRRRHHLHGHHHQPGAGHGDQRGGDR